MPHSDIRGSPGARPSPRLFAACHVLHRLSVPRHPPDALHVPRPRPAPSTRVCACVAEIRGQRSEIRPAKRRLRAGRDAFLTSDICSLTSEAQASAPPVRARTGSTYPCPGPTSSHRDDDRTCFTVTTRFTISKGRDQRSEIGDQITNGPSRTARAPDLGLRHPSCSNAIPMTRVPACGQTASDPWPDTI